MGFFASMLNFTQFRIASYMALVCTISDAKHCLPWVSKLVSPFGLLVCHPCSNSPPALSTEVYIASSIEVIGSRALTIVS